MAYKTNGVRQESNASGVCCVGGKACCSVFIAKRVAAGTAWKYKKGVKNNIKEDAYMRADKNRILYDST